MKSFEWLFKGRERKRFTIRVWFTLHNFCFEREIEKHDSVYGNYSEKIWILYHYYIHKDATYIYTMVVYINWIYWPFYVCVCVRERGKRIFYISEQQQRQIWKNILRFFEFDHNICEWLNKWIDGWIINGAGYVLLVNPSLEYF